MFMATGNSGQEFDLLTVVLSLVVGLGGGAAGALIAGRSAKTLAERSVRRTAATALWNFHRALHDYAIEQESAVIKDGTKPVTKTTREDIASQRALAYPYKSYLGDDSKLVERLWHDEWEQGMDPLGPSDDVWKWAGELDTALTRTFKRDFK